MEEKTRKVYILLTRSNTSFSQLIYKVTHDQFTHSSIGLEGPGGAFYSFARRHPRLMLPAGSGWLLCHSSHGALPAL